MRISDKVLVVGAGAIGMCVAAALARSGIRPVVVTNWDEHRHELNSTGLHVETDRGNSQVLAVDAIDDEALEAVQGVTAAYLTVKSQGTERYAEILRSVLDDGSPLVSLQNGLNEPHLVSVLGESRVIGGASPISAERTGPGRVAISGAARYFVVGELDGSIGERIVSVAALTSTEPWRTEVSTNIQGVLWAKLINNARLNPICVISGQAVGPTVADPGFLAAMIEVVREMRTVSIASGVTLAKIPNSNAPALLDAAEFDRVRAEALIQEHAQAFWEARPSSLQDFERGVATEVPYLLEPILRAAHIHQIDVPVISFLSGSVRRLESEGTSVREEVIRDLAEVVNSRGGFDD